MKHTVSLDDEHIAPTIQSLTVGTDCDADEVTALHRAIGRLGEGERTCITLFYLEEMSTSAIKTALSRGRNHLRTLLTETL